MYPGVGTNAFNNLIISQEEKGPKNSFNSNHFEFVRGKYSEMRLPDVERISSLRVITPVEKEKKIYQGPVFLQQLSDPIKKEKKVYSGPVFPH